MEMNWTILAREAGLVADGRIRNVDVRLVAAAAADVVMCPAAEVGRRISARGASGLVREPTPERLYLGRALSADPILGAAMIVRAVIGRWTVMRGWHGVHDRHEADVIGLVDPFLRANGMPLAEIGRDARQIPRERIAAPVHHADAADAASKAMGQFVRQVDGRAVIVFTTGAVLPALAA